MRFFYNLDRFWQTYYKAESLTLDGGKRLREVYPRKRARPCKDQAF